ncbi:hypothetical protein MRB53_008600 [Persea americana]|uniref:Uncharacterized protein n=1 Tax=Persea americana TaxID=3435 RepID=A0ACC2MMA6_PERAE|nr:hypothetical protein MRB53_008600 [Persea americana]
MAFARVAIVDEAAYFVGGVGNLSSLMVPPMPFSARQDAIELYKSFKGQLLFYDHYSGLGFNTARVVNVLAHRDVSQCALIQQEYRAMYSEELAKRLSSELSGNLKLLLAYVSTTCYEVLEVDRNKVDRDARDLFKAGEKRLGTDENTFIRIFSERSWLFLLLTIICMGVLSKR